MADSRSRTRPGPDTPPRAIVARIAALLAGATALHAADTPAERPAGRELVSLVSGPALPAPAAGAGRTVESLLVAELARQSVLIAARDGLGLSTRDGSLLESIPEDAAASGRIEIRLGMDEDQGVRIQLQRGGHASREMRIARAIGPASRCLPLVETLEESSRGELVEALRESGSAGSPIARGGAVPVPAAVARLLLDPDFISQFAAARALHGLIRSEGESIALRGALARAYAHLGVLTEHHFGALRQAFEARSLLYAQRLVAADPSSAEARWNRAYALILVGLVGDGLSDIEAGRRLALRSGATAPPWLRLVELSASRDWVALAAEAEAGSDRARLAALLWARSTEGSPDKSVVRETARRALLVDPTCLRTMLAAYDHDHQYYIDFLDDGRPALAASVIPKLLAVPGIAAASGRFVDELGIDTPEAIAAAVRVLREAPDFQSSAGRGEPSLSALAGLIQDAIFTHACFHAHHQRFCYGQDPSDVITAAMPALRGYPHADALRAYSVERKGDVAGIDRALESVTLDAANFVGARHLFAWLPAEASLAGRRVSSAWQRLGLQMVPSEVDYFARLRHNTDPAVRRNLAEELLAFDPLSPVAISTLLDVGGPEVDDRAADWERLGGGHPVIADALATRHYRAGRWADALRVRERIAPLLRHGEWLEEIAFCRRRQGDRDGWIAGLQRVLDDPQLSERRGRVLGFFVYDALERGKPDDALRLAEEIVDLGTSGAEALLALCHEERGDVEAAGRICGEILEEDDDGGPLYRWAVRTGKEGQDLEAIWEKHSAAMARKLRPGDPTARQQRAMHLIVTNQPSKALPILEQLFAEAPDPYWGLHLAVVADELGEAGTRDATLGGIVDRGTLETKEDGDKRPYIRLAAWLIEALPRGELSERAMLRQLVESREDGFHTNLRYFFARLLETRGQKERAWEHLKACVRTPYPHKVAHVIAWSRLRRAGVDPHLLPRRFLAG